jgi:hypothetical protein
MLNSGRTDGIRHTSYPGVGGQERRMQPSVPFSNEDGEQHIALFVCFANLRQNLGSAKRLLQGPRF